MPDETFNKYFIDILTILIFFSDLTTNKLSQKLMYMFNVNEKEILFRFAIARVIYDSNGNPIIDVSQMGAKTYEEELLNLSQNTKKLSQLFGIEPSEVKNKLFTNTIEIFMEENADIIVTKTFTSFFYLDDTIYSLSLLNYTWNLNKNTCTIDVKYRWVISDMKLSKIIGDYTKILTSLLKINSIPHNDFNYQFLDTATKYYNFKYYIVNCIKMLKCVLKGELTQELDGVSKDEFDYSASNQKIEGKLTQKLGQIGQRYGEFKQDYPNVAQGATFAGETVGTFGVVAGVSAAVLAGMGLLSAVVGGKKSKKNMKRRNKKRVTRNYKKQNTRKNAKKTRKGVKRAKKIRNTKKQRLGKK